MRSLRPHQYRRWHLCIAFFALLCCCRPTIQAQLEPGRIQIRTEEFPAESGIKTRVFSLTDGDEHGELLLSRSVNTPVPQILFTMWRGNGPRSFDPDRSIPINRRMQFFYPLFRRLLETEPAKTYTLGVYGYTELYDRLLDLAANDKGWNRHLGRPYSARNGYRYSQLDTYKYIEGLLKKGLAYREVVSELNRFGYGVSIATEELRVDQVTSLTPEQQQHISVPVKKSDWLPYRISVAFELTKENR